MTKLITSLRQLGIAALSVSLGFGLGCDSPATTQPADDKKSDNGDEHAEHDDHDHDDHDHGHPSEGPHHGALIELGDEEYHGEIVHEEEGGKVTIYILDSSAKKAVPIESDSVTISVAADGAPKEFALKASPMEGEADGKSSRFVSDDPALGEAIDQEGAKALLMVTIEGVPLSGKIPHHDHDHDHDH